MGLSAMIFISNLTNIKYPLKGYSYQLRIEYNFFPIVVIINCIDNRIELKLRVIEIFNSQEV